VYKQYLKHDPSFMIEEYQGQYLNDQKHGLGTLTNADGMFEGDFVNDKREGVVFMLWGKYAQDKGARHHHPHSTLLRSSPSTTCLMAHV
jgi:uracil DNA glycosylase